MAKAYTEGFYQSKAWEQCRKAFLSSKFFICERCGRTGKIAHHKQYITPENINNPEVTLSWNNLECLCQDCHNKEHHKDKDGLPEGLMFDSTGQLVQVQPPYQRCGIENLVTEPHTYEKNTGRA